MTTTKKAQEACYYHPDVKAYGYCEICGLPICPACINEIYINNERKIICKECLANIKMARKQYSSNGSSYAENYTGLRIFGFKVNIGSFIGLLIELLILGLIAKAIVEIAMKKNISGWFDIDIVSVVVLAFIFWTIFFYGIKKIRIKAPRIVKKVK